MLLKLDSKQAGAGGKVTAELDYKQVVLSVLTQLALLVQRSLLYWCRSARKVRERY